LEVVGTFYTLDTLHHQQSTKEYNVIEYQSQQTNILIKLFV